MLQSFRHTGRGIRRALPAVAVSRRPLHQRGSRFGSASLIHRQSRKPQICWFASRPFTRSAVCFELDPHKLKEEWGKPSFDVSKMIHFLDHDNHEKRAKFRKFVAEDPVFLPKYNISLDEERDLALARLKKLCDNDLISVLDFRHNPLWIFAAHELGSIVDPAMTTKMTVQFNLFGGTVLKLGTERHHDKLLKVNIGPG